jgi:lysophospholipase L1-like esterase
VSHKNVLIIGDSISGVYAPLVKDILAGEAISIERIHAGDSAAILTGLGEWLPGKSPDLIQFNCGLHDARFFTYSQAYQQPINCYQTHLRGVVKWLKRNTRARLLWATTTPVITERITLDYLRFQSDIHAYNAAAQTIMEEAGIPISDLHAALDADSLPDCICDDGVHMTERGNSILAAIVAAGIRANLA